MALQPGTRIGPYEVVSLIGKGGMGEVYRARDARLGRDIALKALPAAFALDQERLGRFRREAHLLASLNHPNIAHIYGLEEYGGAPILVMELVEGRTLAERIPAAGLALDDALPVARQIAEALEAAHEHGVIHRDLKPANVKVRVDGTVKVLDFGLAKLQPGAASDQLESLADSPTVTSPAVTGYGVILGTAAYMSPEQAKGQAADRRSDVWSFGCVLFEMLTGQRTFGGEDVSDTLATVLKGQPPWETLPSGTPPAIRRLLRRALEKDRRKRLPDMGAARLEIDEALTETLPPPARKRITRAAAAIVLLTTVGAAMVAVAAFLANRPQPGPGLRGSIVMPPGLPLMPGVYQSLAVATDGTIAVVAGPSASRRQIYLRRPDSFEPVVVRGSEVASSPIFSPDGRWVAFAARGELRKVPTSGGVPRTITPAFANYGGFWTDDNTILFTPRPNGGLWEVSADPEGSGLRQITTPDTAAGEVMHAWPQRLPGGAILYAVRWSNRDQPEIRVLAGGESRTVVRRGSQPRFVDGRLFFVVGSTLMSQAFDVDSLTTTGEQVEIANDVLLTGAQGQISNVAVGPTGTIVYLPLGSDEASQALVAVDENERVEILSPDRRISSPRVSPDGLRVAVVDGSQIWTYTIGTNIWSQLTSEGVNEAPIWHGSDILFRSARGGGRPNIFRQPADGRGAAVQVTRSDWPPYPAAVTPDGLTLVYSDNNGKDGGDIWTVPMDASEPPKAFLQDSANTWGGRLSPDGHYLLYTTDVTGRAEVWVISFPSRDGKWRIDTDGGTEPVWSRDRSAIFYREGDRMMKVPVQLGETFSKGAPKQVFEQRFMHCCDGLPFYDVAADGRLIMVKADDAYEIRVITQP